MDESRPDNIRQTFGRQLSHAGRQWRRAVDERLRQFGLTDATWLPLVLIARSNAPMRQKDLAESIGIEGSSLVRLIDNLDHAGLIERRADDDRRANTLHLTPRGRAMVEQIEATASVIRQQVLAGISDEELAVTQSVLDRVCAALARSRGLDPENAA